MNLEPKINEELKNAIKSGDKIRLETMRSIRASIIEFNKSGSDKEMNEDDEMKILNSQAKKRRDAIELYDKGGRDDLVEKEKKELEIIMEFLPKQLTENEIKEIVQNKTRIVDSIMKSAVVQIKYDPNADIEFFNGCEKKAITVKANSVKKLTSSKGKKKSS